MSVELICRLVTVVRLREGGGAISYCHLLIELFLLINPYFLAITSTSTVTVT